MSLLESTQRFLVATGPFTLISIAQWPDCFLRFIFLPVGMVCSTILVFIWVVKVTDQVMERQTRTTSRPQGTVPTAERDIY